MARIIGDNRGNALIGTGGADFIDSRDGDDGLFGRAGNDTLDGGNGSDDLFGEAGDDLLIAGRDDILTGNRLFGDSGNDVLHGGDGSDLLDGGFGNDVLNGGDGVDRLDGGSGSDTIDGGAGLGDVVDYQRERQGIVLDLMLGTVVTPSGVDRIINVEDIIGTYRDDTLKGTAADNVFDGELGSTDRMAAG